MERLEWPRPPFQSAVGGVVEGVEPRGRPHSLIERNADIRRRIAHIPRTIRRTVDDGVRPSVSTS